jgi:hypothetical protein
MTIFKGISAARNRLAGWIRDLWSRLLHLNVSIARGYLVVCFLVVLLFALAFGGLRLVENRLVGTIRQDPTVSEAYEDLGWFYWSLGWLRRKVPNKRFLLKEQAWLGLSIAKKLPFFKT